jgi:hypothetical protein
MENESAGRMVAGGLQPERFRIPKNGKATNENADFSWSTAEVTLSRDGSVRPDSAGHAGHPVAQLPARLPGPTG